jgi:pimeloyl-ACP methyl ester carboxylesterase
MGEFGSVHNRPLMPLEVGITKPLASSAGRPIAERKAGMADQVFSDRKLRSMRRGSSEGKRSAYLLRGLILSTTFIAGIAGTPLEAQRFEDLKTANTPLVLDSVGSFYVGGQMVSQTATEIGLYGGGQLPVDQMYVQYMIPRGHNRPAVVLVHGATLTGKSFETTPDGRMGWFEYFARKGYPTYVVDQVGRGRSGFNQAPFNDVRAGVAAPATQPNLRRVAPDVAWVRFRVGSPDGAKFDDTRFPVEAASELAKQSVPDLSESLPERDPNFQALSDLAKKLANTILIGHSQAGRFPFEALLLKSEGIRGLVAIEPPGCNANVYSAEQISKLSKVPILVVFGDHLDAPQTVGIKWSEAFADCQSFVRRVNAANGNATMLHPSELGIPGNSHMMMLDKNNLKIADLIMRWIGQKAR